MGVGAPDGGGPGASRPANGAVANCPTSGAGEPMNIITEQDSGDKINTITMQHLKNALNDVQLTIKAEDKKAVNEKVKVTLVYKCHGCGQCYNRPELLLEHINNCFPTTENVKLGCVCGLIFDIDKHNFAHHCELHRHVKIFNCNDVIGEGNEEESGVLDKNLDMEVTDNENADIKEVIKTTETVDEIKTPDKSCVEEPTTDKDETEGSQYPEEDAENTKESSAHGTEEKPIIESQNTTNKDASENNGDLENIPSPDIILDTRDEYEELFRKPSLLYAYDYLSFEWKVPPVYGEVIIFKHAGEKYQLLFRRYHRDVYEPTLVMSLKKSFKLHRLSDNNDRAWKWTFHYITERGTIEYKSLAVGFLNLQTANEFYLKIYECVLKLQIRYDVLGAKAEQSFISPSQPIGVISYNTTPFGAPPMFGTLPIVGSPSPSFATSSPTAAPRADEYAPAASHSDADWITPSSSKSRKIARNTSDSPVTRYNHEGNQLTRPVYTLTAPVTRHNHEGNKLTRPVYPLTAPKLNEIDTFFRIFQNKVRNEDSFVAEAAAMNNTAAGDSKVSLVYKCKACGLSFDRPEILLNEHLSKCSPTAIIVKTACICGLIFDKYNFPYHCEVHREFTTLIVKKIIVKDEGNIDVSGMKKEFMEDGMEANENKTTVKSPVVERDESNGTVVTEEVASNLLAVKPTRVYKCLCRLSFDRAEFFIKHLTDCSPDVPTVKTFCICGLVFDKHNFVYHCEVHRQFTLLNVKEIFVRDEGTIDIRGMVKEFVKDEEIKVVEKVAPEENMDLSKNSVKIPVAVAEQTEKTGIEKKIEYQETGSAAVEQNNAETKNKENNKVSKETEKTDENPTSTHENNNANKEIIRSHENKTAELQKTLNSASKEVMVSTESSNGEKSELPDNSELHGKSTKEDNYFNNEKDLDLVKFKTDTTSIKEKRGDSIDTDTNDSNKGNSDILGESKIEKGTVENGNGKKAIKDVSEENTTYEIQKAFSNGIKETSGLIETCNGEKLPNNSQSHSKSINESDYLKSDQTNKQENISKAGAVASDKKPDDIAIKQDDTGKQTSSATNPDQTNKQENISEAGAVASDKKPDDIVIKKDDTGIQTSNTTNPDQTNKQENISEASAVASDKKPDDIVIKKDDTAKQTSNATNPDQTNKQESISEAGAVASDMKPDDIVIKQDDTGKQISNATNPDQRNKQENISEAGAVASDKKPDDIVIKQDDTGKQTSNMTNPDQTNKQENISEAGAVASDKKPDDIATKQDDTGKNTSNATNPDQTNKQENISEAGAVASDKKLDDIVIKKDDTGKQTSNATNPDQTNKQENISKAGAVASDKKPDDIVIKQDDTGKQTSNKTNPDQTNKQENISEAGAVASNKKPDDIVIKQDDTGKQTSNKTNPDQTNKQENISEAGAVVSDMKPDDIATKQDDTGKNTSNATNPDQTNKQENISEAGAVASDKKPDDIVIKQDDTGKQTSNKTNPDQTNKQENISEAGAVASNKKPDDIVIKQDDTGKQTSNKTNPDQTNKQENISEAGAVASDKKPDDIATKQDDTGKNTSNATNPDQTNKQENISEAGAVASDKKLDDIVIKKDDTGKQTSNATNPDQTNKQENISEAGAIASDKKPDDIVIKQDDTGKQTSNKTNPDQTNKQENISEAGAVASNKKPDDIVIKQDDTGKQTSNKTNPDQTNKQENISEAGAVVSDMKPDDIVIKQGETGKQTSNATNPNQRKPSKQTQRNVNLTNNKTTPNRKRNNRKK